MPEEKPRDEKKVRKLKPAIPPREHEASYRKELLRITREVEKEINEKILPILSRKTSVALDSKTVDSDEDVLRIFTQAMSDIRGKFESAGSSYEGIANTFTNGLQDTSKKRFHNMLKSTVGGQTDILEIMAEKGVAEQVYARTYENTQLIKSIPSNYLNKIQQSVFQNFTTGSKEKGGLTEEVFRMLRKDIKETGKKARRRAELIARDQTAKITSVLAQKRQENLGVKEYIWSTSQDRRVRGNPAGLYPNVKRELSHYHRDGKKFRWDKPPKDGHPGQAINCRCVAIPVIPKVDRKSKRLEIKESDMYSENENELAELLAAGKITLQEFNKRMRNF